MSNTGVDTIVTYSGRVVSPWHLQYLDVCPMDIAAGLSRINLLHSQGTIAYSLLNHACDLFELGATLNFTPAELQALLLHNAWAAYMGWPIHQCGRKPPAYAETVKSTSESIVDGLSHYYGWPLDFRECVRDCNNSIKGIALNAWLTAAVKHVCAGVPAAVAISGARIVDSRLLFAPSVFSVACNVVAKSSDPQINEYLHTLTIIRHECGTPQIVTNGNADDHSQEPGKPSSVGTEADGEAPEDANLRIADCGDESGSV